MTALTDSNEKIDDIREPVSGGQGRSNSAASIVKRILPVVLAGGAGSRLWPMSREQYPKQLIGLIGSDSLLQATVLRLKGFRTETATVEQPIIVCGDEHRFMTADQMRASEVDAHIIVEPARRDTAPALTLAAAAAVKEGEDAIIVAMPADHAIADVPAFHRAIAAAATHAQDGAIATLGIPPTRPDTGFGYIRLGDAVDSGAHRIENFVEKPAAELAERYLASGKYWWNSGIFIVRASVWLETLKALEPDIYDACVSAYAQGEADSQFYRPAAAAFEQCPSDSIDYAVMERLSADASLARGVVVPLDAGWSDLGSWDAVWDALEKDDDGNAARGRVVFEGSSSSFAHSEKRLIACVGVTNVVVVETDDAVLVADRSRVQEVKSVVTRMRELRAPEADIHRKVRRPWGYYDSIDQGERFQVKRIVVNPGGRLSLQLHHHRAEHWIVVSGTALVTRGNEEFLLSENQSTFIPLGVAHRLENPGKLPLELIEVQSGAYLGEDDIVRFDDVYGRA